jgi:hypothetical protein
MATIILDDMSLSIGGTDIAIYIESGSLTYGAEVKDDTTMTANTRKNKGGLKVWAVSGVAHNDWADNALDEDMFQLVGTEVAMILKPTSSAISATNPAYTGQAIMTQWDPIAGGQVGEIAKANFSLVCAGDLDRDVVA